MAGISAFIAFGAGLLSFLSPCVLPLIPSWLFFLGSQRPDKAGSTGGSGRAKALPRTAFFVLGFSAVFTALSIIISSVIIFSGAWYIDIVAGIIIIIFGLNVLFDFLKFLNYEKRIHVKPASGRLGPPPDGQGEADLGGAFLVGAAFGAGWTPCIGPILASILLMAGQSGRLALAVLYLVLYSAGFGLPFLAAAFFFDRFLLASEKIKKKLPVIRKISGVLLVITGILILSGRFQALSALLSRFQSVP